jgi:Tol biopolymer transport system component
MRFDLREPVRLGVTLTAAVFAFLSSAPELDAQTRGRPPAELRARLNYVASVRQLGPVAYRDPLGALSPDGEWLAFTSGRRLAIQRVTGGPVLDLARAEGRFTWLTWHPNSRQVVAREQSFDRGTFRWYSFNRLSGEREPVFPDGFEIRTPRASTIVQGPGGQDQFSIIERRYNVKAEDLDQLTWSPSGRRMAGVKRDGKRTQVWLFDSDGGGNAQAREIDRQLTNPVWHPNNADVACLSMSGRDIHPQLEFSCAGSVTGGFSPVAYGPFRFSADGRRLYYAAPNELGTLDLWVRGVPGTGANPRQDQLTRFSRDTYAPSVSRDGKVLFKTQDYRANIAYVAAEGGTTRLVTAFQSETPSWAWSGSRIAFTFGGWRRAADDLRYPDIEQHLGYVTFDGTLPEDQPGRTVRSSDSEDQGMHWSPNGKWVVFHSHAEDSDDIWLMPADGPGEARRISDDGHETGWPRWSPDGRWIVYPSFDEDDGARRGGLYLPAAGVRGRRRQRHEGGIRDRPHRRRPPEDSRVRERAGLLGNQRVARFRVGGLRRAGRRGPLPVVAGADARGRAGAAHVRSHRQGPPRVLPPGGPDRVHAFQLRSDLLAYRAVGLV